MRKSFLILLFALNLVALPLLFVLGRLKAQAPQAAQELPVYGTVADFELLEKDGGRVNRASLEGRPWLANFMFAHCPAACPMMSAKLSGLQKTLPEDIRFVSFSVDPQNDTPAALTEYAKQYHAVNGRWLFLTGGKEAVDGVLDSLLLARSDDPNLHTLRFILIDGRSRVRGYYDSQDAEAIKKLTADAALLLKGR